MTFIEDTSGRACKKATDGGSSGVDKGLVTMFLNMSPEERLLANDKAAATIMELRGAYLGFKRNT